MDVPRVDVFAPLLFLDVLAHPHDTYQPRATTPPSAHSEMLHCAQYARHSAATKARLTCECSLVSTAWAERRWQCGAVFPTSTKQTETISLETLAAICRAVDIPVVAIGGITAANAGERRCRDGSRRLIGHDAFGGHTVLPTFAHCTDFEAA